MSRLISPDEMEDRWQQSIGEWSERTFPEQTDARLIAHLREEVGELAAALETCNDDEIRDGLADCELLLLVIAHTHQIRLRQATAHKHAINLRRTWQFDPEKGFDKHVEGES